MCSMYRFQEKFNTISTSKAVEKKKIRMHVGILSSPAYHVLSNLLRWHPTVLKMTIWYESTWTFQLDYLVDKSNNRTYLLNYIIMIPF